VTIACLKINKQTEQAHSHRINKFKTFNARRVARRGKEGNVSPITKSCTKYYLLKIRPLIYDESNTSVQINETAWGTYLRVEL